MVSGIFLHVLILVTDKDYLVITMMKANFDSMYIIIIMYVLHYYNVLIKPYVNLWVGGGGCIDIQGGR